MKKISLIISVFIICAFAMVGCEKNNLRIAGFDLTEGSALVKLNMALPYRLNPGIQVKFNDVRIAPLFTNTQTSNYAYPFPGGGLNTQGNSAADFLTVTPGTLKVGVSFPKAGTNQDSVVIYTTSVNVEANKVYTLHLTDTSANVQSVLTTENQAVPDSGFTRYTFVNLIPNLPAVDLYFGTTLVAANIAYKAVSPTFTLASPTVNAFAIRPAGAAASTTAIATYATGTVPDRRVMTVYSRGYNGIAGTTDIRRPQISLFYVR